ncbi:MAG: methylated-DNA--[protein]-cysteine S-methyltransferase [Actinomycetota bacterium]|nr:methylated-DNA--[protein]-cysteine S-methyltransferase [Actinomycetota bacterium]
MDTIETQLAALSPGGAPPVFTTAQVSYAVAETSIGRILLALNDSGALVMSRFTTDDQSEDTALDRLGRTLSPRVLRLPGRLDEPRRQLDEFLSGTRRAFDLRTDLVMASGFQRSVLGTLAETVGYGERATYGALASAIHRPTAARAVGAALGANPLCVVLPCHRVVGSSGALTGYAGGVEAKRYLLDLEAR